MNITIVLLTAAISVLLTAAFSLTALQAFAVGSALGLVGGLAIIALDR